jgi:hypothetical protein
MDMDTSILRLEPRSFVSVVDVINGGRKLVVLDEKGIGYFDVLGFDEIPKPLLAGLEPKQLPSIVQMITGQPEEGALLDIWDQLTKKNVDVLTMYRGLSWAVENKAYDIELIERMGGEATGRILAAREVVEKALTT